MAREKFTLISEEEKQKKGIKDMIETGEINADNFHLLDLEDQEKVSRILFDMAESKISLAQGVSALEFVLFSHIRLSRKHALGLSLTAEDKLIEERLNEILSLHEITNADLYMNEWLFDYLEYAKTASLQILANRKEHIERKEQVTGKR